MKSIIATGLLGLAILTNPTSLFAQEAPASQPVAVAKSQQIELAAADGYTYSIRIGESLIEAPAEGYGVLYVLDANPTFLSVLEAVRFQKGLNPTIVVGIAHRGDKLDLKRRFWDLTPKTPAEHLIRTTSSEGTVTPEGTGGQDAFLQFIETKLKPEIAKRYKINPNRQAIFGHSLSARFVLHVLATQPDAFDSYLAASPSVWWDNGSLFGEVKALKAPSKPKNVLVTIGEFEQKTTPNTPPERADFFAKAKMVDNARDVAKQLGAIEGLNVKFYEYPDENHGSVVPLAISRGVRIALAPPPAPAK